MFQKLAKVRSFGLWLAMPQREAVRSRLVPCNDNRPRPDGRVLHSRRGPAQRLACRWSLCDDGRLACRWEIEADNARGGQPDASTADPPCLAGRDPQNMRKAVAG